MEWSDCVSMKWSIYIVLSVLRSPLVLTRLSRSTHYCSSLFVGDVLLQVQIMQALKNRSYLEHQFQGWIIHEAGEAEASGPRAPIGAWTARYNENLQSRTTLGPKISREKMCGLYFRLRGAQALWDPQLLSCVRARRDRDPALSSFVFITKKQQLV